MSLRELIGLIDHIDLVDLRALIVLIDLTDLREQLQRDLMKEQQNFTKFLLSNQLISINWVLSH